MAKVMTAKFSAWRRLASVVLLGVAGVVPLVAQEPAPSDRTSALEREVAALRAEVEALKQTAAVAATAEELARRIDVLAQEIEKMKLGEVVPEATEVEFGLGPAASKVYRVASGVSVGGYGELLYQGFDSSRDDGAPSGRRDDFDALRAVLYFGYKFSPSWILNSEIEVEHGSTGEGGEVSAEFLYLDYLWRPELNLRGGLVLVPMGLVNELHEPTVFLGARRPDVESAILPSTWRELGVGAWGDFGDFSYRAYVVNGLDATGFSAAGLRGGRQKGARAKAEDFAVVGRLDWAGVPGLSLGASAWIGDSGQDLRTATGEGIAARTEIFEVHGEWKLRGFEARGLWAKAEVGDVAELNRALGLSGANSVGEELEGYYLQLGYDLLSRRGSAQQLVPFVRFESLDTQAAVPTGFSRSAARQVESFTLGLSYKPIDRVVLKADFQDYDNDAGTGIDQLNVAIGYTF
jgi:hypothetical protein